MKRFCNECSQEFFATNASIINCKSCNKKLRDRRYKDKIRHGGKREKLIKKEGLSCVRCGKVGNRFQIVTHHLTHDSQSHTKQVNLCRACHMRVHDILGYRKDIQIVRKITKAMVEEALNGRELEDACKILNITRSALYKLRMKFDLKIRKPQKLPT